MRHAATLNIKGARRVGSLDRPGGAVAALVLPDAVCPGPVSKPVQSTPVQSSHCFQTKGMQTKEPSPGPRRVRQGASFLICHNIIFTRYSSQSHSQRAEVQLFS